MSRITLALTGALMASGLLVAPSAQACNGVTDCPGLPGPVTWDPDTLGVYQIYNPLFYQQTVSKPLYVTMFNDPEQKFEATELYRLGVHGGENYNLSVTQDISGNIPIGEQYNDFTFLNFPGLGVWGEVYDNIGGTPDAFYVTPFGDIDLPTAFVEAVGPSFFEPWASVGM